ncbi:putative aryl-alcohol dehydrogenase [Sodiomyces alkalinus F11]|uniref:Aldo-keto reductase ausK n=1 Tax=Sodiomyces alkalinus (strain CBS 110278 / VKM F-3762 / F11) TaxID=1314773 RepID=A0A3N2Q7F7_SODAK|nr:putative aryl-alcohol dehydrogenase [Sodiomyces alkalinus F11]ROT42617.1 putative aryl-alcohol dehydrogenase [Sodiomyces alkalinus F11]
MPLFKVAPPPPTELGRLRVLSSTAGIRVSPLALGAMSVGQAWSSAMGSMTKEASFELLDTFVAAGGNLIDTSNNYQNEESETWIGEWSAARGNRDRLVIATKYTSDYRSHEVGQGTQAANASGNHRRSLHTSVRASLKKLQTDYIDILFVHYWDYTTSIKEMMDALHMLVQQGKVLYLGASDAPAWVVSAANTYANAHGKTPFSVYQGRWSIMHRDFEREILPMARSFGLALMPWDVLGGGKFQSREAVEERKARGEGLRALIGDGDQTEEEVRMSEALAKVAAELGTKSVTGVALAYVRHKAGHVVPIVGGRKVEHLKDNIAALSLRLSDEQIAFLESVRPFDSGFPSNFLGEDPNVTGQSVRLRLTSTLVFPGARRETSV